MRVIRPRWFMVMLGMCLIESGLAEEVATAPSLDLLEYLGMMVEEDDGLIGPEDLDNEPDPEPFPDSILIHDGSSADQQEGSLEPGDSHE